MTYARVCLVSHHQGRPTSKGLDLAGFQTVVATAILKNYDAKFKQKNRFTKWSTSLFKKFALTSPGYLSFAEFVSLCQEVLKDPKVRFQPEFRLIS